MDGSRPSETKNVAVASISLISSLKSGLLIIFNITLLCFLGSRHEPPNILTEYSSPSPLSPVVSRLEIVIPVRFANPNAEIPVF